MFACRRIDVRVTLLIVGRKVYDTAEVKRIKRIKTSWVRDEQDDFFYRGMDLYIGYSLQKCLGNDDRK